VPKRRSGGNTGPAGERAHTDRADTLGVDELESRFEEGLAQASVVIRPVVAAHSRRIAFGVIIAYFLAITMLASLTLPC